jgi:hypothetical protein
MFALPIAVGAPIPAPKQAQLRNDDFRHLPRIAIPIVILACLQPAFEKQELPGRHVLPRDFSQPIPTDAAKPFHPITLLTVAGLERLVDSEREAGKRLACRGKFQFCIPSRPSD